MGILDHFKGGELDCGPGMHVKTFKKAFKKEVGVDVKVYVKNSHTVAKDNATLGSTKTDEFKGKGEEVKFKLAHKVGDVEKMFKKKMGVQIQILNKKGGLAENSMKLGDLKRS